MSIQREHFGNLPDGRPVHLFTLSNRHGSTVAVTDYGAILTDVLVPDRHGTLANINLTFPNLAGYLPRHPYLGATVGRFCNRIAHGRFKLDGETYQLAQNLGSHHLHGGNVGFDRLLWEAAESESASASASRTDTRPARSMEMQAELVENGTHEKVQHSSSVRFSIVSPDGDEGYPGALTVVTEFTWNDAHELTIDYRATTDRSTVINLTNHSYWNLAGAGTGDVLSHELQLMCDSALAVDDDLIPTGEIVPVADTPLDFRQFHRIGERIDQLAATKGYDHCYAINGQAGRLRPCATVKHAASGRVMEVLTTQPGVQLYTGNHLDGQFSQHSGLCLETQHYPDSPNHPSFPTTRLNPGDTFHETTVHRFSVA